MFKKIINKIIMGTKCYLALKEKFVKVCDEAGRVEKVVKEYSTTLQEQKKEIETLKRTLERNHELLEMNADRVMKNKTTARRIVRIVNNLIKREDSVNAIKEIKVLCNEIIKGE